MLNRNSFPCSYTVKQHMFEVFVPSSFYRDLNFNLCIMGKQGDSQHLPSGLMMGQNCCVINVLFLEEKKEGSEMNMKPWEQSCRERENYIGLSVIVCSISIASRVVEDVVFDCPNKFSCLRLPCLINNAEKFLGCLFMPNILHRMLASVFLSIPQLSPLQMKSFAKDWSNSS